MILFGLNSLFHIGNLVLFWLAFVNACNFPFSSFLILISFFIRKFVAQSILCSRSFSRTFRILRRFSLHKSLFYYEICRIFGSTIDSYRKIFRCIFCRISSETAYFCCLLLRFVWYQSRLRLKENIRVLSFLVRCGCKYSEKYKIIFFLFAHTQPRLKGLFSSMKSDTTALYDWAKKFIILFETLSIHL